MQNCDYLNYNNCVNGAIGRNQGYCKTESKPEISNPVAPKQLNDDEQKKAEQSKLKSEEIIYEIDE